MRPPPLRHLSDLSLIARVPVALTALLALQLLALRHFDYSKAWLARASLQEARIPRDPMALGDLHWDTARYQEAAALAPLRALVANHCPGKSAVDTAECLSDLFARRFAHGVPSREFFDRQYSPAAELAEHLAGTPGHCVTRSGLLAAAMLSAGFPARVVQLLPSIGLGHNVAEVWDPSRGWVFVDPTYRVTSAGPPGASSAAAILGAPGEARWHSNTNVREAAALRADFEVVYANLRRLLGGHLVYPDPWLYTRVGHRSAPAPFQGRFVIVGPPSFRLGIAQPLLHIGITLTVLALVGAVLSALARLGRRPLVPDVDLTHPASPVAAHPAARVVRSRDADVDPPGSAVA
jgi:hypothetical protein